MAQGSLFRVFNNIANYKTILYNSSRITISGHQQSAGIKHELRDKVQDLNIPEKPKRPLTPYFRYAAEQRPLVIKKFPNLKLTEMTKKIAEDWTKISANIKEEYSKRYQTEMESYKVVSNDYKMKLTPAQKEALELLDNAKKAGKERRLSRKLNKEENKPKRPIGPYMQFLMITSKREGLKMNEILSSMKGKWAMLSDFEKDKYKQLYDEDKNRYETEMQVWEAKMMNEGKLGLVRLKTQIASKPSLLKRSKVK